MYISDIIKFYLKDPTEKQTVQEVGKHFLTGIYNAKQREQGNFERFFNVAIIQLRYSKYNFEPLATEWMRLINEENYFASEWLNKLKKNDKYQEMLKQFVKALRLAKQQLGNKFKIEW